MPHGISRQLSASDHVELLQLWKLDTSEAKAKKKPFSYPSIFLKRFVIFEAFENAVKDPLFGNHCSRDSLHFVCQYRDDYQVNI